MLAGGQGGARGEGIPLWYANPFFHVSREKQKKNEIKAIEKLFAGMPRCAFEGFVQVALNAPDVERMRTLVTLICENVVWDLQYCAVNFPTALSVYIHSILLFRSRVKKTNIVIPKSVAPQHLQLLSNIWFTRNILLLWNSWIACFVLAVHAHYKLWNNTYFPAQMKLGGCLGVPSQVNVFNRCSVFHFFITALWRYSPITTIVFALPPYPLELILEDPPECS